jgi:Glyoxalase-like domain
MSIELDHLFVCTDPGAPEAEELVRFGLREGPPNRHPGQGTANRCFAFSNAMIELLWVSDAWEAQSEDSRRTLLWERWSGRKGESCPFGICLRPTDSQSEEPLFPAWEYRPSYLPDPLVMHIGEAGVEEPMWVYLSFMRRADREQRFVEHPVGIREISGLTLTTHVPLRSTVSLKMIEAGILLTQEGRKSLLEIDFDGNPRKESVDFRPHLPLIFRL